MADEQQVVTIDLAGDGSPASVSSAVPELREDDALDLPERAELQPDGSVMLRFEAPAAITYRVPGAGDVARTETFDHLVLRRLKGAQIRRVMTAAGSRAADLTLALCTGISEAKLKLLYPAMEAADLVAARQVVSALIDADGTDLPERAAQQDDGTIVLRLRQAATDGEGVTHSELVFRKFKADALIAMQTAKDLLGTALHRATGLTLKAAAGLIDDMDAADVMAAQRVIGFLSGIGRRSGG